MNIEFVLIPFEGESISQTFDLTQLGGEIPQEGDCYTIPDVEPKLFEVYQIIRVFPSNTQPYHLHVICREVQEEECEHDEDEPEIHRDPSSLSFDEKRDLWQQFNDTEKGEK